jgi:glycosyltransferase involved in cell wall biosynthesis
MSKTVKIVGNDEFNLVQTLAASGTEFFVDTNSEETISDFGIQFTTLETGVDLVKLPSRIKIAAIGNKFSEAFPFTDHINSLAHGVIVYSKEARTNLYEAGVRLPIEIADPENESSTRKIIDLFRLLDEIVLLKNNKALIISPYNDETGIAEYTEKVYSTVASSFKEYKISANGDISKLTRPDNGLVVRNWCLNDSKFNDLLNYIKTEGFHIVHMQYHPGAFTSPEDFNILLSDISKMGVKLFVTLHAVTGKGFDLIRSIPNLKLCTEVFMHNNSDIMYGREKGLTNLSYLPLYKLESSGRSKAWLRKKLGIGEDTKILATHGLLNTNKGIPEVIKAASMLKDRGFSLLCLNAVSQNNTHAGAILKECRDLISELGLNDHVRFITDFLQEDLVMTYLEASDYIVYNYSDAGESASAAVNKGLSSGNPVIITDIPQFSELKDECLRISGNTANDIAEAVYRLEKDDELKNEILSSATKYIEEHSNYKVAMKQLMMIS